MTTPTKPVEYPLVPGSENVKLEEKIPEDFEFYDEKNCLAMQKFVACNGRKDKAGQGIHALWYLKTGKPDEQQTPVEFHLTFDSRFGIGYSDDNKRKEFNGKLARHLYDKNQPKQVKDGKEVAIPAEPGYGVTGALRENMHLKPFCDFVTHANRVEYSRHSVALSKLKKFISFENTEAGCGQFAHASDDEKKKEQYGESFGFKILPDSTEFYEGTVPVIDPVTGKQEIDPKTGEPAVYDIPTTFEKLWNRPGTFETWGRFYKMNLETKVGTNTALLVSMLKFTPAKPKLGKAANHRRPLPKDFKMPDGSTPTSGTSSTSTAPVVPPKNSVPDDVVQPLPPAPEGGATAPVGSDTPVSPTKDDEVLGAGKPRQYDGSE